MSTLNFVSFIQTVKLVRNIWSYWNIIMPCHAKMGLSEHVNQESSDLCTSLLSLSSASADQPEEAFLEGSNGKTRRP